ncbi:MAG: phosphatidate cytidylyltransferase [Verrucomicrobiales bacterium]
MSDAAMPLASPPPSNKAAVFARRLSSTLALWAVLIAAILTENRWLCFGLIALIGGAALVEWRRMFAVALPGAWAAWLYLISAGYAVALFLCGSEKSVVAPGLPETLAIPILLLGLFLLSMRRPLQGRETLWRVFSATFGFLYIPLLLAFVWRLLQFPGDTGQGRLPGVFYMLYVVAVTKFTDMGAYFFGMLLGRHKMIPTISPGKTWEGFAGGFAGAFFASHLVVVLWPQKVPLLNHSHAAVLAVLLALVTVTADLAESVIKRCLGVKDSGRFLPGIGGALDLIDSVLFTAPLAWAYLKIVAA